MPLPEFTRKLVETRLSIYCENRIPVTVRNKVRLAFKIRGNNVTLYETRPYFMDPSVWTESPIAQFRFDDETKRWNLYCCDRNSKWYLYSEIDSSANFDDLLKEVDRDPTGIFWG